MGMAEVYILTFLTHQQDIEIQLKKLAEKILPVSHQGTAGCCMVDVPLLVHATAGLLLYQLHTSTTNPAHFGNKYLSVMWTGKHYKFLTLN